MESRGSGGGWLLDCHGDYQRSRAIRRRKARQLNSSFHPASDAFKHSTMKEFPKMLLFVFTISLSSCLSFPYAKTITIKPTASYTRSRSLADLYKAKKVIDSVAANHQMELVPRSYFDHENMRSHVVTVMAYSPNSVEGKNVTSLRNSVTLLRNTQNGEIKIRSSEFGPFSPSKQIIQFDDEITKLLSDSFGSDRIIKD